MLTLASVLIGVLWLLLAGFIGYSYGKLRAWRAIDPEINQLVRQRLEADHRAAYHARVAQEYHRLWQMWQRTAFQWARQGWPEHRAHIDEQEAKLATSNLLTITRANYHAPRPPK